MKLAKEQREALTRALAVAFPSSIELDQLTQFKLGQRLNQITDPAPHLTLALRVVNWVEARDRLLPTLLAGALNQNPENSDLQQVAREVGFDEGAGRFEANTRRNPAQRRRGLAFDNDALRTCRVPVVSEYLAEPPLCARRQTDGKIGG